MTTLAGAQSLAPLVAQYNAVNAALTTLQQAVAAGASIEALAATINVGGIAQTTTAAVALNQADSATIMRDLIAIYQSMLSALQTQILAVS